MSTQNLPSIVLPFSFIFSNIDSVKYHKLANEAWNSYHGCETRAGKIKIHLCCKCYWGLWIYFSTQVSSSLEVGSPIAPSQNSDVQRLWHLKEEKTESEQISGREEEEKPNEKPFTRLNNPCHSTETCTGCIVWAISSPKLSGNCTYQQEQTRQVP